MINTQMFADLRYVYTQWTNIHYYNYDNDDNDNIKIL